MKSHQHVMALFLYAVPQVPTSLSVHPVYSSNAELSEVLAQWIEIVSGVLSLS